jgi:RNA polymerase sigma factor (sigma-70 family)
MSHAVALAAPPAPVPARTLRLVPFRASEATDAHLLDAVRGGNDDAYAELYRRYESEVRRYSRSLVNRDDVDDLVSESFARMLQALRRSKGPVDHPIRYLLVTARTTAITLRRRGRRQQDLHRNPALRVAMTHEAPFVVDDQLVEALVELAPRWRKALWLNVIEGRSPSEIGQQLELSPAGVSALLYRAKRALRHAYLAKGGETPPSIP